MRLLGPCQEVSHPSENLCTSAPTPLSGRILVDQDDSEILRKPRHLLSVVTLVIDSFIGSRYKTLHAVIDYGIKAPLPDLLNRNTTPEKHRRRKKLTANYLKYEGEMTITGGPRDFYCIFYNFQAFLDLLSCHLEASFHQEYTNISDIVKSVIAVYEGGRIMRAY
ncbi:uncharacterized protein LAJ45_01033 [Morchella importuna]|uniref:uncharacterized protein n=1 Tax=Morchella importuna TaxID=1174673 RepID=UPI001E8EF164|nr:uncharacterized protein LAJ45_01033 [Morchella importuna]KAH8154505.1 hypothetical protein LAJ45_01033 [Morchella importuna]